MAKIQAITFDLWDTIFIDDSDEPKRAAAGRLSKPLERRRLVREFLQRSAPISPELVNTAYDAVDASFRKTWHELHVTWEVRERLELILKGLGRTLPDDELDELTRLHEEMELEFRPDFIEGVHAVVKQLSGKFRLGVISDAIFSPGRALRELLRTEGLLDCFEVFIFSDEAGRSKPAPEVFLQAAEAFGISPGGLVHIGDREHNDVAGPHTVGARAIMCTAAVNRGGGETMAEGSFATYDELPSVIAQLDE